MPKKHLPALAATSILLFATACASQPDDRRPPGGERGNRDGGFSGLAAKPISILFTGMDINRDTVVDASEFSAGMVEEWARLSNGNDVDLRRYTAWSTDVLGYDGSITGFMAYDPNLDGKMTEAEFSTRLTSEFQALDANGNGSLERSELLFRVSRPSRGQGREQGRQRGQGGRGGQGGGRRQGGRIEWSIKFRARGAHVRFSNPSISISPPAIAAAGVTNCRFSIRIPKAPVL